MIRLAIVVVSLALLGMPGSVLAGDRSLRHGIEVAERVWGAPCDGRVKLRYREQPGRRIGLARWWLQDGERARCRVELDPSLRRATAELRCSVLVHEYGHLAGREHSHDRGSVMYPTVLRTFPGCRKRHR